MSTRLFMPLMLLAIVVQALLGGISGSASFCMGGGHDTRAEVTAPVTTCAHGCDHGTSWPTPVPVEHHDDECACIDIVFYCAEWITVPKLDDGPGMHTLVTVAWAPDPVVASVPVPLDTQPPAPPWGVSHAATSATVLRTTRLLL